MPEATRPPRGILDTSVVIDLDQLDASLLPFEVAVSVTTMAELAAGPHATTDPEERGRRQDRLQRSEAAFDSLPFDDDAARAYGQPTWGFHDQRRRLDMLRSQMLYPLSYERKKAVDLRFCYVLWRLVKTTDPVGGVSVSGRHHPEDPDVEGRRFPLVVKHLPKAEFNG